MARLIIKLVLLLPLALGSGIGHAQTLKENVEARLSNIDRLLTQSSGAKQVIDSGNTAAGEKRQRARELFYQAEKKAEAGDYATADKLLKQASMTMFEAIRLATPASVAANHEQSNFVQRKESVLALRDAFNRISDENAETESKQKVNAQLDDLVGHADQLSQKGSNTEAKIEIDKAYHLLKVSIESIRSGQTLVRSLQFETAEQEYDYEIDRNDTHSMLISLLVDDKEKSEYTKKQIVEFVGKAAQLRKQAEAYANDDAFEQAIELLEESTKHLVRAIRSAGIYIPG